MKSATEPVGGPPQDLARAAGADFEKYARLINELNIRRTDRGCVAVRNEENSEKNNSKTQARTATRISPSTGDHGQVLLVNTLLSFRAMILYSPSARMTRGTPLVSAMVSRRADAPPSRCWRALRRRAC